MQRSVIVTKILLQYRVHGVVDIRESVRERIRFNSHSPDSHCAAILNDDLVNLGVASKIKVGMFSSSGMNVGVSTVTASSSLFPLS